MKWGPVVFIAGGRVRASAQQRANARDVRVQGREVERRHLVLVRGLYFGTG